MARGFERPPAWALAAIAVGIVAVLALFLMPEKRPPAVDLPEATDTAPTLLPQRELRITVPAEPRLYIMGDSFTQGYGAEPQTQGWAYRVADELGWDHRIDGVGGSGWTSPGGTVGTLVDRVHALAVSRSYVPNVVILQGGLNDFDADRDAIQSAIAQAVTELRSAFPGVQIVLFGPVRGWIAGLGGIESIASWTCYEAYVLQVPCINPMYEHWVTETNPPGFAAADGAHPTTEGHAYLAVQFLDHFRKVANLPA